MKRRTFLKIGSGATAGLMAATAAGTSWMEHLLGDQPGKIKSFGIQLWTLRDEMPKDPKDVLKQVASMGYKHVESFEGAKGMFWGMKNTEFKQYISDLGMTIHSSHFGGEDNFEKKVEDAAAIGMKYMTMAWEGPNKTIDDYKRYADAFNKKGEICKKHGMRFVFHNHDYTFRLLEGQYGQDVLMNNTDASLVDFEMDIFWVVAAGQNPEAWFRKYPNRFRLCHVKDRSKNPSKEEGKNSVELGTGSINYAQILKTAKQNGMKHFIVEQEAYPNGTPVQAAKTDADYMKSIRI